MDVLNTEWISLLGTLNDAASERISAVSERLAARAFEDSGESGARIAAEVDALSNEPNGQDLVRLYKMSVMHARRSAAIGTAQFDGIVAVLRLTNLSDVHTSVAPLARSAAEHFGLAGWLTDPGVGPRTRVARHIACLNESRQAFEGIRSRHSAGVSGQRAVQFAEQQEQAAQRAGLSLRRRDHDYPVRGKYADWVDATLRAGAAVGIENQQSDTHAPQIYGLLSSLSHPSIIEQVDSDRWEQSPGQTLVIPQARPEIIRLAGILVARLLRTSTWLSLHLWGLELGWSEESRAIVSRL